MFALTPNCIVYPSGFKSKTREAEYLLPIAREYVSAYGNKFKVIIYILCCAWVTNRSYAKQCGLVISGHMINGSRLEKCPTVRHK
jgi:hypothetical protein